LSLATGRLAAGGLAAVRATAVHAPQTMEKFEAEPLAGEGDAH
jgi:hypothetical protein